MSVHLLDVLLPRCGQLGGGGIHQLDAASLRSIVLHFTVEDLKGFGWLHSAGNGHICHAMPMPIPIHNGIRIGNCIRIRIGIGIRICVMGRRHELNFPGQIHRFVIWFTSNAAYLCRPK